jgi:gamma-glutamylcyclotransferase (GGCT)/AIG2-like uncharacterized protein YtfP
MKEQQTGQIFVYGSLRSGFHSPAYNYISKYFTLIGNAKTKGLLLDMGDYPVAIATTDDKFIVGELYKINHKEAFDFAIAQLDDYEGVNVENNETQLYTRAIANVEINESTTTAWVYWYTGNVSNKPIVASGDVMDYLMKKM